MGTLKVPDNITSITIGGVALIPSAEHFVVVSADQATGIIPQQSQPKLMGTDLLGNATVKLPPSITAISFDGVAYAADGQNQITLPPTVVTQFLGAESWHPFWHFDPSGGVPIPPVTFNPATPIPDQNPIVGTPFVLDVSTKFQNGPPPKVYSIFSGSLPPGLALNPGTGIVSGTPTTPGNSGNVVFRATDAHGNSANSNGVPFNTAAAFNPADLFAGGHGGVFYDFSNPATLWADFNRTVPAGIGGMVCGVTDLSGNNRHLSTGNNNILMQTGCLEFPNIAGNIGFQTPFATLGNAAGFTLGYAFRVADLVNSYSFVDGDYGSLRVFQSYQSGATFVMAAATGAGYKFCSDSGGMLPNTTHVAVSTVTPTAITIRRNGAQTGLLAYGATTLAAQVAPFGVGGAWLGLTAQNQQYARGRLGAAFFINRVLTAPEIAQLEAWLESKRPVAQEPLRMLLHFDTDLQDSSGSRKGATALNPANVSISATQKVFGAASLRSLDTPPGMVQIVDPFKEFDTGWGDCTWQCRARFDAVGAPGRTLFGRRSTTDDYAPFTLGLYNLGVSLAIGNDGATGWQATQAYPYAFVANQWYHFAVVKSGATWRVFVDGVMMTPTVTQTVMYPLPARNAFVSGVTNTAMSQYIDEVAFHTTALWTANFTPPAVPYADIPKPDPYAAYNPLLIHADTAIVDVRGHAITANAGASLSGSLPKFGPGSLYLPAGGYITSPDSSDWDFPGAFTLELWARFIVFGASGAFLFQQEGTGWAFFVGSDKSIQFNHNSGAAMITTPPGQFVIDNVWRHIAVSWDGVTYRIFKDGVIIASVASAVPPTPANGALRIGNWAGGAGYNSEMYLDEICITKGFARYVSAFTPPVAPYAP